MQTNSNPPISSLLRWMTIVESVVLLFSGAGLFFAPELLAPLWPWELAPFNARAIGALYFTSLVAAAEMARHGRWSPARVVTPMIFTFTAIVLVVSLAYLPRFTNLPSTTLWFILYIAIPVITGFHLWRCRRLPPANPVPTPSWLRTLLIAHAALFMLYGIAMLLIPTTASAFWPWRIDEFHARLYSVGFITPALGCLLVAQRGSAIEYNILGLTQMLGGITSIMGLLLVDTVVHRVDWSQAGSWAWLGFPILLCIVGTLLQVHTNRLIRGW